MNAILQSTLNTEVVISILKGITILAASSSDNVDNITDSDMLQVKQTVTIEIKSIKIKDADNFNMKRKGAEELAKKKAQQEEEERRRRSMLYTQERRSESMDSERDSIEHGRDEIRDSFGGEEEIDKNRLTILDNDDSDEESKGIAINKSRSGSSVENSDRISFNSS